MAKTKKTASPVLIRSDKNLLALGLFSIALLIGIFVYFDYRPMPAQAGQYSPSETEHTYRVETAPATLTVEESSESAVSPSFEEDSLDSGEDY